VDSSTLQTQPSENLADKVPHGILGLEQKDSLTAPCEAIIMTSRAFEGGLLDL